MSSTLPKMTMGGDQSNIKNKLPESDKKLNNTVSNFSKRASEVGGSSTFLQNIGTTVMNSGQGQRGSLSQKTMPEGIGVNFSSKVPNLKLAIEQLDLIPENEEKEYDEKKINNTNLFKKFKIEDGKVLQDKKLDDINTFNNTIMSSKNWGDSNLKNPNKQDQMERTNYYKPNKKNLERELGRSIVDTQLPRARLPNRFIEKQIVSKSTIINPKKSENN